jgi:hypothetical protein
MKPQFTELLVSLSEPQRARLIWVLLAMLAIALAGGAPNAPSPG